MSKRFPAVSAKDASRSRLKTVRNPENTKNQSVVSGVFYSEFDVEIDECERVLVNFCQECAEKSPGKRSEIAKIPNFQHFRSFSSHLFGVFLQIMRRKSAIWVFRYQIRILLCPFTKKTCLTSSNGATLRN